MQSFLRTTAILLLMFPVAAFGDENDQKTPAALQIIGINGKPLIITLDELRKLPRTTVDSKDRQGQPVRHTGVALHVLLAKVEVPFGKGLREHWLRGLISVEAHDEYRVVFALPELDPAFTDRLIILADEQNGKPLDESRGPLQIIVPGEKRHARWVRNVEKIRVLDSLWADEREPTTSRK